MNLYLHIPFCASRCSYCDFYTQTGSRLRRDFLDALIRELHLRRVELPDGALIDHIYFGGGTPSQLPIEMLRAIFRTIRAHYDVSSCREITLEANPDDLSADYLRQLHSQLPIRRISLGVQSFDDADLHRLRRRHDSQGAIRAVGRCLEAGFTDISIDLIYGLPDQTPEAWARNLDVAFRLGVSHLSAYHLTYEVGTPLHRQLLSGRIHAVSEDVSVRLYRLLTERAARAGWEHYEVSNFSLPGRFARHNSAYWTGARYIGVGPSAHSYDGRARSWNVASLPAYVAGILSGRPDREREVTDDDMRYNEYLMTRLRTMWGISLSHLRDTFGPRRLAHFLRHATPYIASGRLVRLHDSADTIRLTEEAFFVSDGIISSLFV